VYAVTEQDTVLLGVLGFPARHSLSPRLHARAFAHLGMRAVYLPLEVPPERLEDALAGARALRFRGLNVTMPHKEAVFRLADTVSAAAGRCRSANTLTWDPAGRLLADSTDGPAVWQALAARGAATPGEAALVLGAGGAARAAAFALGEGGMRVTICARHAQRAQELALELRAQGLEAAVEAWSARGAVAGRVRVVVQATPLGGPLHPRTHALGPDAALREDAWVVEMAYGALPTPLETWARALGRGVIDGREILARQAALSWRLWFGVEGPLAVMEAALRESPGPAAEAEHGTHAD